VAHPLDVVPLPGRPGYRIVGEIDSATAESFRAAVGEPDVIAAGGSDTLYLDMSEVSFIDSSGCHALLALARSPGGALVILDPSQPVARTLELMKIDHHPAIRIERSDSAS
jgi:anti-anti-sigma factor